MKNYFKGVWDYFTSHMLFMYLGAVIFAWIDIWFFKKIEPSTITATASTITLGLAIYALAKVNEWIRTKKSEKAFERTTLFLDTLFKMKNAVQSAATSMQRIPYKDLMDEDFSVFNEFTIDDSKIKMDEAKTYNIELQSIMDSFFLWNVRLLREKEVKSLIEKASFLSSHVSVLVVAAKHNDPTKITEKEWDEIIEAIPEHLNKINSATEIIQQLNYDEMFKISK